MKLVSYLKDGQEQLALLHNDLLYDMDGLHPSLPSSMAMFLNYWDDYFPAANSILSQIREGSTRYAGVSINDRQILSPVPSPVSLRDAYAFRQHVEAGRRNRGMQMIPEFDQFPVFYFSNHNAVFGPGNIYCMPDHFEKLDFELEVAVVINRSGRNIPAAEADEYIAGFMIMNDFSARALQMEEMKLNLGPAKGKDFATALGPVLVTTDELESKATTSAGTGKSYDLPMRAYVNGVQVSEGNLKDMSWTFAEIIERVSYGATLFPGDVIGSGTVGTGCFLELNGTAKRLDNNAAEQWLKNGDEVVLEVEGLGSLRNIIAAEGG